MSDPHSLPNDTTQAAESGPLLNDWEQSERSLSKADSQFDGKIIARMPDFGSESLASNIEKSTFWENIGLSIASMIQGNAPLFTRFSHTTWQRFFLRFAAFGCLIVLCGLGIFVLEWENKPIKTENAALSTNISEINEIENEEDTAYALALPSESDSVYTAVDTISNHPIPAAPVADEYSPWGVTPRQPVNSATDVASGENPPTMVPQSAAVAMSPMIDMSMPISPYEQQLLAQANIPAQQPIDPFVQQNGYMVPGIIPMHERQENPPPGNAIANAHQSMSSSLYPQYLPPTATQNMYPQYGPATPPNMPIPNGVSTLPGQGGYYQQPHGPASVMPSHPGDLYHAPPAYRRVY